MGLFLTALRFMRFDPAKSIGVLFGIVISTFLIGQQVGILDYLFGLMAALVDNTQATVWVTDSKSVDVNQLGKLRSRTLTEIRSIPGVAEAYPLVFTGGLATFSNGRSANVSIIGSEAPYFEAGPRRDKILAGKLTDLAQEGALTADVFDSEIWAGNTAVGTEFEVNGKRAHIAAQTKGVRGFGNAIAYTTLERARYFGAVPADQVSCILVRVRRPGTEAAVVRNINTHVPGVRAWPSAEFRASTVTSTLATTSIAQSTGTLVIFALIAGFFIIGLTMYSSALDRIKDYGTLKAIGASNGYIRRLILGQALLFAGLGFVIAYGLLEGFRQGVADSGLTFDFTLLLVGSIFGLTVTLSVSGAAFALRRIRGVEPASVFRG